MRALCHDVQAADAVAVMSTTGYCDDNLNNIVFHTYVRVIKYTNTVSLHKHIHADK